MNWFERRMSALSTLLFLTGAFIVFLGFPVAGSIISVLGLIFLD